MAKKIVRSVTRFGMARKNAIQFFKYKKGYERCLIILGCQRSGTTLITHLFNQLRFSRVFGEFSVLSNIDEHKIRLNPLKEVISSLNAVHAPLVILKPLVESHRAEELLNSIENSSIIWVYRNFKDAALSSSKKTKSLNGHGNILSIVENKQDDWRNEGVSPKLRELAKELYLSQSLSALDAACLFWYIRNSLYFDQQLNKNQKVHIWKYEDFLGDPAQEINGLLHQLNLQCIDKNVNDVVYTTSVNQARDMNASKEILNLCEELESKLDASRELYCKEAQHKHNP